MANERILVVEDDRAVARGLAYGLRTEGFEVSVARTGTEALAFAQSHDPHLILLDIRLPDIDGFTVCRQLRDEGFRQPIVMLTARDEEVDKVLGLELGADDYVVKPYSLRELISRIRAMLRRAYGELAAEAAGGRLRYGEIEIDLEKLRVLRRGEPIDLTPTEFRLLRALASRPGRPISRESLIEDVWGYASDIGSTRTVDAHVRHLRLKLEDDPANPRWVVTLRGIGYKFEP
ncbi:MAG: response regulator transcription factor [Anaerolineae bacterium]|jgi:DNA-binding response OmpR family regulator